MRSPASCGGTQISCRKDPACDRRESPGTEEKTLSRYVSASLLQIRPQILMSSVNHRVDSYQPIFVFSLTSPPGDVTVKRALSIQCVSFTWMVKKTAVSLAGDQRSLLSPGSRSYRNNSPPQERSYRYTGMSLFQACPLSRSPTCMPLPA